MANENNYYVIGGQYESICYGGSATLRGAKSLATRRKEYWDNWQGWQAPRIYRAEDTELVESCVRITTHDGQMIRIPKQGAIPYRGINTEIEDPALAWWEHC